MAQTQRRARDNRADAIIACTSAAPVDRHSDVRTHANGATVTIAADRLLAWNEGQSTPGYGPECVQFRVDLRAVLIQCRRMEAQLDDIVGSYKRTEIEAAERAADDLARIMKERQ